jgi:prepilin-type N-terminal cleavage/methylation domain-containing protein
MKAKARGFSLIELLVVVFILAVGLTSVSALFVAGTISTRKAQRISTATNAALQQLERIRSAGFSGCVADADVFTTEDGYTILEQNPDMTGQIGFAISDLPSGQGTIDIAFYTSGAGVYPNLKDVTVTVTWAGGAGTGGTTRLQTFVANRPE